MPPPGPPGRDEPSRAPPHLTGGPEPPRRQGASHVAATRFVLPRRAGSTGPFSAERSHGECPVAPLLAAIRRHPPLTAGYGHPHGATRAGGSPALGSEGQESEGAGEGWLGAAGPGGGPNIPLNMSPPVGSRSQEASEARGCTQALDAGQADGRLRECGPSLGLKLGSGLGLWLRPGSEVGQPQSHQGKCSGAARGRAVHRASCTGQGVFNVKVFVNSVRLPPFAEDVMGSLAVLF